MVSTYRYSCAHVLSSRNLCWGNMTLECQVYRGLGGGDLLSIFRNCLVRRSAVDDDFVSNHIWKCVNEASALC